MGRTGRLLLGYLIIVVLVCSPLLSVAIASGVAWSAGCTVHEASTSPCLIAGIDVGGTLYDMAVMGWLIFATMPLGAVAVAGWTVAWAVTARRQNASSTPAQP
jgi:hypothetical protein